MKTLIVLACMLFVTKPSFAIETKLVEYKDGDLVLEGFIAYPDQDRISPGILIAHQWMGLGPYEKGRAKMLAQMGFVAMAVDIYGKGVRPKNREEASKLASQYRSDRQALRQRLKAAHEFLMKDKRVISQSIAAIGYCFGGGAVIEYARSGANIKGVASFHGNLDTPQPEATRNIRAKILVLHGAADPHVPPEQVTGFQKEMDTANADWQLISYGHAVHSFTEEAAGNDPSKGAAYNENADLRSWAHLQIFLKELFGP